MVASLSTPQRSRQRLPPILPWAPREGTSHEVPRALLGTFRVPRAAGRGRLQRGKGHFFFPWREFYLRAENSPNAGGAGAFRGGLKVPPCRSPRMDFNSLHDVQTSRDGRGPAPPGVTEEAARIRVTRGGREASPGPSQLSTAWISGGITYLVAVPSCSGERSGL